MKTIYLEIDEEITSVIDKIKKSKEREIVLIFPKEAIIARSIVSLKLLKKQAEDFGKKIIISSLDDIGINLAKRVGLKTAKQNKKGEIEIEEAEIKRNDNLEQEKETKEELIKPLLQNQEEQKETEILAEEKKQKREIKTIRKKELERNKEKKVPLVPRLGIKLGIPIIIFLTLIFYLAFFYLPKARIDVIQKTETKKYELEAVIDAKTENLDLEKNIIPGKLDTKEFEVPNKKFDVKGEKEIGDKARGEIFVYNKYSSKTQVLSKGTQFKTQDKIFLALSDFEVPGAKIEGGQTIPGQAKVEVEAEKGGTEYNISPSTFVIVSLPLLKQEDIWGESRTKFSGGTSKKIKALSEDDLKHAREELTKEGSKIAEEEIKKSLSDEKMLIPGSLKTDLLIAQTDTKVGQEATTFEINGKVKTKFIIFNKKDLEDIISSSVEKKTENKEFIVDKNLDKGVSFEVKNFDEVTNKLLVKIKIEKTFAKKLNIELKKDELFGLKEPEVKKKLLENSEIKEVSVSFWPFWVNQVPKDNKKIDIFIKQNLDQK